MVTIKEGGGFRGSCERCHQPTSRTYQDHAMTTEACSHKCFNAIMRDMRINLRIDVRGI